MNPQEKSNPSEGFQVEDPLAVFTAFSQEEIRRWRSTEPEFDEELHQEAVSLVLGRLKQRLDTAKR
ncbi:MAG: hypothetical protein HQL90_15025 [Magnetococcales bacterium]|nr:hypothetical protein [Magnetococcales bacterium]